MTTTTSISRQEAQKFVDFAKMGDLPSLTEYADSNPRYLAAEDEDGRTALHWACAENQLNAASLLLQKGADPNHTGEAGWCPLHSAASKGLAPIVELLMSSSIIKTDMNLKTGGGQTALHYAAGKGHLPVVELLVSAGANVNAKDKSGSSPLMRAASQGQDRVVAYLVRNNANINSQDKDGDTPLHMAINGGHESTAVLLVQLGAAVDTENSEKKTPIDICPERLGHRLATAYAER